MSSRDGLTVEKLEFAMFRSAASLGFLAILLGGAGTAANAQTAGDNSVFIGQTGNTNAIAIEQDGNGNVVGGPTDGLPLGQDGRDNQITIRQTGSTNSVATNARTGVRPSLGLVATGTGQLGNRNVIDIIQDTLFFGFASTAIEAIQQQALAAFSAAGAASNELVLRQSSLAGAQSVGQVIQTNTAAGPDEQVTNRVTIMQAGDLAGDNTVVTVLQNGSSNDASIFQTRSGQEIGTVRQIGTENAVEIEQSNGLDNAVLSVEQNGILNRLELLQSGSRNQVAQILQNNNGVGISGNRVTLTLAGDDNGGNGATDNFRIVRKAAAVYQAMVSQIGDDNSVGYVTSDDSARNLYGFSQEGDGNGATGTVSGDANETAVRQIGDDNSFSFLQNGEANAVAADFIGERNRVALRQNGTGNLAIVSVNGNSNNALQVTGFSGNRLAVAVAGRLKPGDILQGGALNTVDVILTGDLNAFAFSQQDQDNRIYGIVSGTSNQAVVTQAGTANVASFSQRGKGNGLTIQQ
jgi:hypothetical protein